MKCIKCSGQLEEKLVNGVAVDQCTRCFGIWFDAGELDWLVQLYKIALDDQFKRQHEIYDTKSGHCPRCRQDDKMVQLVREHREFHIDMCPVCHGHWLEAGELNALRQEHRFQELKRKVHDK